MKAPNEVELWKLTVSIQMKSIPSVSDPPECSAEVSMKVEFPANEVSSGINSAILISTQDILPKRSYTLTPEQIAESSEQAKQQVAELLAELQLLANG